ncbi:MAG: hypothetical protein ABWZ40_13035 [Caulobacterales bacterium]
MIDDRLARLSLAENERGLSLQWRAGRAARDKHDESYAAVAAFEANGRALRPWSAGHIRAEKDSGGAVQIAWVRRARWGGDGWEGNDPPPSEESELYEVRILDGATIKRRLTAATPGATYALADQIADFGGAISGLSLEIAQISSRTGAGITGAATFTML